MFAISRSQSRLVVFLLWLPLLGAFCSCGCSDGVDVPDLTEVTGVVTLDGKPLPNVDVTFEPQTEESIAHSSFGTTNEQGQYELALNDSRKGAVIGQHTVRIRTSNADETELPVGNLLPEKFDFESNITKEVKAGPNEINIDLLSVE